MEKHIELTIKDNGTTVEIERQENDTLSIRVESLIGSAVFSVASVDGFKTLLSDIIKLIEESDL